MPSAVGDFELAVRENWSRAVMGASSHIAQMRGVLLAALHSVDPEVRRAAIAALNDADDADAHDQVRALIADADGAVREEVLEYLEQFPLPSDAELFLGILRTGPHRFLATSALIRLFGGAGPLVTDDDPGYARAAERWGEVLRERGIDV